MIARQGRQRARARLPARPLEVIVSCDGSHGRHAGAGARGRRRRRARQLPRGGKIRAQDAAVERAHGDDRRLLRRQRAVGARRAARARRRRSPTPRVGYVCGQVRFVNDGGARTRRALYWRYEMWLRALESRLASVTGGQRRDLRDAARGLHRGRPAHGPRPVASRSTWSSAAGAPSTRRRARATEKMVPSIEGEFARKRRMMSHAWPIVLRGGLLSPRGYPPLYALMIVSHRVLRYATPFLHVAALALNLALVALGAGPLYCDHARGPGRAGHRRAARRPPSPPARCSSRATTS